MTVHKKKASGWRHLFRSLLAIFAGFVFVFVFSLGTDLILHTVGLTPPLGQPMSNSMFLLATIYRTIYAVIGCYLTARLAPSQPMTHALIGGFIGLGLSIVGAVMTWNHVPSLGPHWYSLALVVTALPAAWIGGKLRLAQLAKNR